MGSEEDDKLLSTLSNVFGHQSFKSDLQEKATRCVMRGNYHHQLISVYNLPSCPTAEGQLGILAHGVKARPLATHI